MSVSAQLRKWPVRCRRRETILFSLLPCRGSACAFDWLAGSVPFLLRQASYVRAGSDEADFRFGAKLVPTFIEA